MLDSPQLKETLKKLFNEGEVLVRSERNPYLKYSYKGAGKLLSDKWNVKVYTSGAVVCNDEYTLEKAINGQLNCPNTSMMALKIDDAGVGYPLLGVMVGVTDGTTVATRTVDVKYFQTPLFESKEYLKEYARQGMMLIQNFFQAKPEVHRIEICTGFVNTHLKDMLRDRGFDVRVTEIKGLLQDTLEDKFRAYVKETLKADMGYDPKVYPDKRALARKYYAVLDWGKKYHPELLKSGWESMKV